MQASRSTVPSRPQTLQRCLSQPGILTWRNESLVEYLTGSLEQSGDLTNAKTLVLRIETINKHSHRASGKAAFKSPKPRLSPKPVSHAGARQDNLRTQEFFFGIRSSFSVIRSSWHFSYAAISGTWCLCLQALQVLCDQGCTVSGACKR